MKMPTTDLEKIFAIYTPAKRLVSTIHTFQNSINHQLKGKKGHQCLNRHFTTHNTELVKKPTRRCSTPLVTRQTQMRTRMKFGFTSTKLINCQRADANKCPLAGGVPETPRVAGGNINYCNNSGNVRAAPRDAKHRRHALPFPQGTGGQAQTSMCKNVLPWLVGLSGLSAGLQNQGSPV